MRRIAAEEKVPFKKLKEHIYFDGKYLRRKRTTNARWRKGSAFTGCTRCDDVSPTIRFQTCIDGKHYTFQMARVIYAFHHGHYPNGYIHHKDGNYRNFSKENLVCAGYLYIKHGKRSKTTDSLHIAKSVPESNLKTP